MALHTIPSTMEGENPMDRIANAEAEIEQHIEKARIEEHEQLKYSSCPHIDSAERLEKLKKKLQGDKK